MGLIPQRSFQSAAHETLEDSQLRANLRRATGTIRDKRAAVVEEMPDWEQLRAAGAAIKDRALLSLDVRLAQLEREVVRRGGQVHWARDGAEANAIVCALARSHGVDELVKVKSIATDEIGLNEALAAEGVLAVETDLAELIIQLGDDVQSHILVPAIHRNRGEIRDLFERELGVEGLSSEPAALAEAARLHLRRKFLDARMGVSGANFAVAETGTVCVVESEGNGRMCTTLPEVLVTVMGIEKLVAEWGDMEAMLQLLPRSSTGERMNPYTSFWTGVRPGDGPREFHLVLLDNGRSAALADSVGRQALRCIRCSACLNVCPVYSRAGGHAYGSVYPGPIGAILTPQLTGIEQAASLPYASSLCGACADVCPVGIEIPKLLVHLRAAAVDSHPRHDPERLTMQALYRTFRSRRAYESAQRLGRLAQRPLVHDGRITRAPGPLAAWTNVRDLPAMPNETFRDWWRARATPGATHPPAGSPAASTSPAAPTRSTARSTGSPAASTRSAASSTGSPAASTSSPAAPRRAFARAGRRLLQGVRGLRTRSSSGAAASPDRSTSSAPLPHASAPGTRADFPPVDAARRTAARDEVLRRIRAAIEGGQELEVPREYRRVDRSAHGAIVDRFEERASEYSAWVRHVDAQGLREQLASACREHGARRIAVPADLPADWLPDDVEAVRDEGLSPHELDQLDGALTGCAVAIAETGTIVLDGGAAQGRRALTLVPDLHLCVVQAERIVGLVPEAVETLAPAVAEGRPLTFISGPSATSDIELARVEGVHGPRRLEIFVVAPGA